MSPGLASPAPTFTAQGAGRWTYRAGSRHAPRRKAGIQGGAQLPAFSLPGSCPHCPGVEGEGGATMRVEEGLQGEELI